MKTIACLRAATLVAALVSAGSPSGVAAQSDAMARAEAVVSPDMLALIHRRIVRLMTFVERGPQPAVHWAPRDIELIDFVISPSRTYSNTNLYAFRYVITLLSDRQSLAIHATSCQVAVVDRDGTYTDPSIGCEPPNLGNLVSAL